MIAFGIRYLSGYAAAMDLARQRPEWPVHPGRIFFALVAAHYETGAEPEERVALEWLESLPPPSLHASPGHERSAFKTFVPVNDGQQNPVARSRQERSFPKVWLEDETACMLWASDPPHAVREALSRLCRKVTRIGHSTSLVQMWVADPTTLPAPNWIPTPSGSHRLRVAESGTLAASDEAFNQPGFERFDLLSAQLDAATGKQKQSLKAQLSSEFPTGKPEYRRAALPRWHGYAQVVGGCPSVAPSAGPFHPDILIFARGEGPSLGLEATLALTGALRNAILKSVAPDGSAPEWISGHSADGSPAKAPHLALFPLPFVGRRHADGHIMGLAIALPAAVSPVDYNLLGPFLYDQETGEERRIEIWTPYWNWPLHREASLSSSATLRASTWVGESTTWASVTPVVLHHHPKKKRPNDVERIIREAFASALLPEPEEIEISPVSYFEGAGDARSLPTLDTKGAHLSNYQTHIVARFASPVTGPFLVGRGRFRGYGLLRPVTD